MIQIVDEPIDLVPIIAASQSNSAGAMVLFTGSTREFTSGKQTTTLKYDCYREMALLEMEKLREQATERWQLVNCVLVHRIGEVPLGEMSVAIATASGHRPQAYEASRWLIDELKKRVPIWKQENYADGSTEWVHPNSDSPANSDSSQVCDSTNSENSKP